MGLKENHEVDDKIFRQYLETYKKSYSFDDILNEIQDIRIENF
jgi:hypothetical protein